MKTLMTWACAALTSTLAAQTDGADKVQKLKPYAVGSTVDAALELRDVTGKLHKMADYRGKVVIVHFWSITCPSIKWSEDRLKSMTADYAGKDVVHLAINSNRREIGAPPEKAADKKTEAYSEMLDYHKATKLNFPILPDHGGIVAKRFQAKVTPHCFVVDQKGVLRYSGALDDDQRGAKGDEAEQYVRNAVDALLAGKDVKVKTTRPWG